MCNLCKICKKNKSMISIAGDGDYCFDCYNQKVLDEYGMDNTFNYSKNMAVIEPDGTIHSFEINHVILGCIVSWEANEIGGHYHFKEISDIDANGAVVAQRFFKKIVDGVCTKTLDKHESRFGTQHTLKPKGTISIVEDEDRDFATAFEIDGEKYTPEEFADLCQGYPGFNMIFQIHDASEPLLGENEYLVPVKITKQSLEEELYTAIAVNTDNSNFMSYKNTSAFDELFIPIIDKLEILVKASDRTEALAIGKELAKMLKEVETDDDMFPYWNIETVCRTVDPYRTDEELWGYLDED